MSILTTRVTNFTIDDLPFAGQLSSATIKPKANGWRAMDSLVAEYDYTINITAGQDLAAASFWQLVYAQEGQVVPIVLKPYGNDDEPTTSQPWVSTTAIVTVPDGGDFIGGGPDASTTTRRTFEVVWDCDRPVLVTTAP